jgi:hypothetical protein
MRCVLAKSTRHLIWRIRTLALIISIVFVLGSTSVFARGGGHSGGHGGGHSGGHGGHSGGHAGHHHGGHIGNKLGGITGGSSARGHFYESESLCPYGQDFGGLPPTWREAVADDSSRKGSEQV